MKHLFNEISKHPHNHIVGAILVVLVVVLLYLFRYSSHLQRQVVYLASGLYLGWSLWHHYRRGDITASIVLEYLILALLALIVVSATL